MIVLKEKRIDCNTISYSRMDIFMTCHMKWYKQYILNQSTRKIPAFAFGKAVHKLLESYLAKASYKLTGEDFPYIKDNIELEEEIALAKTLTESTLSYLLTVPEFGISNINNIKVTEDNLEKKFELNVGNGVVRGYIDWWYVNENNEIVIVDWKTTSQEYKKHQIISSLQLTVYAYAFYRLYGKLPDKIAYVTINKKTGEIKDYFSSRSLEDVKDVEKQLQINLSLMDAELNDKNPRGCYTGPNNDWRCEFYKECWNIE